MRGDRPAWLLEAIGAGAEIVRTLGELRPGEGGQVQLLFQVGIPPFLQPSRRHGGILVDLPCMEAPLLEPGGLWGRVGFHPLPVQGVGDPLRGRGVDAFQISLPLESIAVVLLMVQPTDPSISRSIRRFNSTAYSKGSSLAMGSMNPRTMRAMASASDIPLLIR